MWFYRKLLCGDAFVSAAYLSKTRIFFKFLDGERPAGKTVDEKRLPVRQPPIHQDWWSRGGSNP